MTKFLVCRPMGGFNDILCQIQKCLEYSIKYGRTVIVDTSQNPRVTGDFADYFESLTPKLVFIHNFEVPNESYFPKLKSINSYQSVYSEREGCFISVEDNLPLTFDFGKDYKESYLLHSQPGGGLNSAKLLTNFRMNEKTEDIVKNKIGNILGSKFDAIHIRNTDYKTDYNRPLTKAFLGRRVPVFVATDSPEVKSFEVELRAKHPDHLIPDFGEDSPDAFINVLSDFCLLIRAARFTAVPLKVESPRFSGFTRLAKFGWLVNKFHTYSCTPFPKLTGIAGQKSGIIRCASNYLYFLPLAKSVANKKVGLIWQISSW